MAVERQVSIIQVANGFRVLTRETDSDPAPQQSSGLAELLAGAARARNVDTEHVFIDEVAMLAFLMHFFKVVLDEEKTIGQ